MQGFTRSPAMSRNTTVEADRLSQYPGLWSHTSQALLMRTPPPPDGQGDDIDFQESGEGLDDLLRAMASHTPGPQGASAGLDQNRRERTTSKEPNPDTRRYIMSGHQSRTRSGRPKRLSSKLPLESIALDAGTHAASTRLEIELCSLIELLGYHNELGLQIAEQDATVPLGFRDMEDVVEVESLLRELVSGWLEENPGFEVEYTLRSGAKGKAGIRGLLLGKQ
ncbi:hypothetical protein G7046_g8675 [Stylonectria norvegica]|nr:hypothetical protein G7046_g8675 [Stylonectria norvegica]